MRRAVLIFLLTVALAAGAAAAVADASVVGWWRLDEGSGTVISDSSGHDNAGILSPQAQWVDGYFGTALSVDGSTGRASIPNSSSLEPSTSVSVSAWVKGSGPEGGFKYIVAKGAASCIAASYGLYTGPTGGLTFYVATMNGHQFTRSPAASPSVWDGNWHYVVGTYDGSSVRLYVDGAEIGDGSPVSGSVDYRFPDSGLFLGHYSGCTNHDFRGVIDEPQVWNSALGPSQVLGTYNALESIHGAAVPNPGSPPPPAPPLNELGHQPKPGTTTARRPVLSRVSLSRLATGRPRLSFNLSSGSQSLGIKSFTVRLPSGLGVSRRLKQLRAGVSVTRGGHYELELKPRDLTITMLKPARGVSVAARLPELTERRWLIKRVQAALRHRLRAGRPGGRGATLTLALRVSDSARHHFSVSRRVRAAS